MFADVTFCINCLTISLKEDKLPRLLPQHTDELGGNIWFCPHKLTSDLQKQNWIFPLADNLSFIIIAQRISKHLSLRFLMKYCRGCFWQDPRSLSQHYLVASITCVHLVLWSVIQIRYFLQKFSRITCTFKMSRSFESRSVSLRKPGK